jgi:hypothetical protein
MYIYNGILYTLKKEGNPAKLIEIPSNSLKQ